MGEGSAMFILISGQVEMTVGEGRTSPKGQHNRPKILREGASFGEEVILGLVEQYDYSVQAVSFLSMLMIPRKLFLEVFLSMPKVWNQMRINWEDGSKDVVIDPTVSLGI